MAREIVNCLEEQKGEDILLLDIHEVASFTDYFVICTGTSDRMLDNLATKVSEMVHERYGYPRMIEGRAADGWQVLDLGDVVVHLFAPDRRDYYRLEQLWERGKVLLRLQ
ncbi:MAG TPA: ribosome silencing factor [Anaerolineaceae bacterium]